MDAPGWSTQQLAEFIAAVSSAETERTAARAAVERAAEALDADVAAIVAGGELVAAVGYAEGGAPVDELERVRPGAAARRLEVPGVGSCAAAVATLEHPPGATLVLARAGGHGLTREETALLRRMARVAAMTMRMLRVIDDERVARAELERLAREQAALRTSPRWWPRRPPRTRCSQPWPRRSGTSSPQPTSPWWAGTTPTVPWRSWAAGAGRVPTCSSGAGRSSAGGT